VNTCLRQPECDCILVDAQQIRFDVEARPARNEKLVNKHGACKAILVEAPF
jgi:hypothetical protein